jgi:hypothetical protein
LETASRCNRNLKNLQTNLHRARALVRPILNTLIALLAQSDDGPMRVAQRTGTPQTANVAVSKSAGIDVTKEEHI